LRAAVLPAAALVQQGDAGVVGSDGRCAGREPIDGPLGAT
jgi:hypothetical protein